MIQERNQNEENPLVVKIGSTVTYKDHLGNIHTYTIVPENETKILEGVISSNTPLAKAILGKSVGEHVKVKAPGGEYAIEVLKLETSQF